jgi:hypothetical protein
MPDPWLIGLYGYRDHDLTGSDRTAKPGPCIPISADRHSTSAISHPPHPAPEWNGVGDMCSGDHFIGVGHIR